MDNIYKRALEMFSREYYIRVQLTVPCHHPRSPKPDHLGKLLSRRRTISSLIFSAIGRSSVSVKTSISGSVDIFMVGWATGRMGVGAVMVAGAGDNAVGMDLARAGCTGVGGGLALASLALSVACPAICGAIRGGDNERG